jgi:IclR family transcriptional regulator, blcABC operon repressor
LNVATTSSAGAKASTAVPALARTNRLLEVISRADGPRGSADLARELGLPRSTVHGLCNSLAERGILAREQGGFEIGPHVLTWSSAFKTQNSLGAAFATLAETIDRPEAVNLAVLDDLDVMYVGCRAGTDVIRISLREGTRLPAAYSATGKAMLSTYSRTEVEQLFKGRWPAPMTELSVESVQALNQELEETRTRGYSVDDRQLREVWAGCGAPVFSAESGERAVAGVTMAMVASKATPRSLRSLGKEVRALGDELSRLLGA